MKEETLDGSGNVTKTETNTREYCFDTDTGFLEQTRAWEGTGAAPTTWW